MPSIVPFPFQLCFEAIGTQWEIESAEPLALPLQQWIRDRIELFDKTYSRFRPDSLVTQMDYAPVGGRFEFPERLCDYRGKSTVRNERF